MRCSWVTIFSPWTLSQNDVRQDAEWVVSKLCCIHQHGKWLGRWLGMGWERLMAVRIVRLGSARSAGEGLRIGTVRRPPRGVPKTEFASRNWYDVWFPNLAPSVETMKLGQEAKTPAQWARFIKKYRAEMATPEASHALELLAALSHHSNFS